MPFEYGREAAHWMSVAPFCCSFGPKEFHEPSLESVLRTSTMIIA